MMVHFYSLLKQFTIRNLIQFPLGVPPTATMIVFDSLAGDLIGVILTLSIVFITYCKWSHQYWKRRNLQFLEPTVPFGNFGDSIRGKENLGVTFKRLYGQMKAKGWKHGGIYVLTSPNYIPVNLDYVKNIMAKDFQYFVDRTNYLNEKEDPLNAHLVNLGGTKWRNMRTKLTPTFTSGKMKMMFQTLADCQVNLLKKVDEECAMKKPLDIKELLACFTTDIIGSCAFGLDFNSFEQENSPFRLYGKKVFTTTRLQRLKKTLCMNFPELALYFNISTQPKDITDFFINVVKDTIDHREKKNYTRNDFMQLLIDMKNGKQEGGGSDGKSLTLEEVAAQSFVFFLAGFETSSTLMTFALYELARHLDIQEKVRSEVETVLAKHDGKVSYDAIQDMKYMNQVIDGEVLCVKKYSFD
jgi:cytochrome P450 family 6